MIGNPSSMGWRTAQHSNHKGSLSAYKGRGAYGIQIYEDRKDRWEERASSARDDPARPYPCLTAKSPIS